MVDLINMLSARITVAAAKYKLPVLGYISYWISRRFHTRYRGKGCISLLYLTSDSVFGRYKYVSNR